MKLDYSKNRLHALDLGRMAKCSALYGALFLFTARAYAQPLTFTFSPTENDARPRLRVMVAFDGDSSGITYLGYQDNQFGEPNQMDFVDFPPQKQGISVVKAPDSSRFIVRHAPNMRVEVMYELSDLQKENEPFFEYCCYKPIIRSEYFHIQSGHLLAPPEEYWKDKNDLQTVQLRWENFPKDWVLHNSFGPDHQQTVKMTNSQFMSSIFVGGDFRRTKFEVKGRPVYFLTRGQWHNFTDGSLDSLLQKTVEGHRAFWNDFADSIYTVTFLPVEDTVQQFQMISSAGGSGLTNSFLSYATNNQHARFSIIRYIYVHELMHRWIGIKIENAQEERQYWFSEGFTEYFTLKNSLRYGFINTDQFLKELNDNFSLTHARSSKNTMPNDSMNYRNFWSGDKEWEKLPYERGCLFAFYLDNRIREKSGGTQNLDMLMRDILTVIARNPTQKLDHPFFKSILRKYLGRRSAKAFNRYIERGERIDFGKTQLPEGMNVLVRDVTLNSGPSPDVITKTEIIKQVPMFGMLQGVDKEAFRKALLR